MIDVALLPAMGSVSKRILLAGDTHGDLAHCRYLIGIAELLDCQSILQLGDFGYWEHTNNGMKFLDSLEEELSESSVNLYWLRGNHENHWLLYYFHLGREFPHAKHLYDQYLNQEAWVRAFGVRPAHEHKADDSPFWQIRNKIWYIEDGKPWIWEGVRLVALGGAYSIDVNQRSLGTSWWEEEVATEELVESYADVGKVDLMLLHDTPVETHIENEFAARGFPFRNSSDSFYNRHLVSIAANHVNPDYIFGGHYHTSIKKPVTLNSGHQTYVHILSSNIEEIKQESWTVVELKDGAIL